MTDTMQPPAAEELRTGEYRRTTLAREPAAIRRAVPLVARIARLLWGDNAIARPASDYDDRNHNTDIDVVAGGRRIRFGQRTRAHRLAAAYGRQFCVRTRQNNGGRTEMSKVMSGEGDYMLYGFLTPDETAFRQWIVVSWDVFREIGPAARDAAVVHELNIGDGSTANAYDIDRMPSRLIVCRSVAGSTPRDFAEWRRRSDAPYLIGVEI